MLKWLLPALVSLAACTVNKKTTMHYADNPVIAHRGAFKAKGLPENSIAALREAIRLQCAGSEFDIWMTADDSLVVNHDPRYFGQAVETTAYAGLAQRTLSNGESLPLLRQYLAAGLSGNHHTRLVLEIKPSTLGKQRGARVAEAVVAMVRQMQGGPQVVYISFDYDILKTILALEPTAITQYLEGDKPPARLKADGIAGLDYHYSVYRKQPTWAAEARQLGLQLNAWTVNNAADMAWLLDQGFHFITTNEPELLLRVFAERKMTGVTDPRQGGNK